MQGSVGPTHSDADHHEWCDTLVWDSTVWDGGALAGTFVSRPIAIGIGYYRWTVSALVFTAYTQASWSACNAGSAHG
ncbi:MAG: hypothetical protein ACRDRL_20690 [Sciscionella sp.]